MDSTQADRMTASSKDPNDTVDQAHLVEEIRKLREDFQLRLITAGLRTEAVREAELGPDDKVVDGRQIMDNLRRHKPWLFGTSSSSSAAEAPASQPVRHKNAMEMNDEEYLNARTALTKRRY
jgi:hypothetical protein